MKYRLASETEVSTAFINLWALGCSDLSAASQVQYHECSVGATKGPKVYKYHLKVEVSNQF